VKRFDLRARLRPVLITLGAVLALNVLLLFTLIRPRQADAASADATTASLAARVDRAENRVHSLAEAEKRLQEGRAELDRFYDEVLSSKAKRLVGIQRELQEICDTFAVQPTQISFAHEPVKGTDLVRIVIDLPLVGGYNNLRQFIQEVEHSKEFLILESIQLQESEQGGALLNLKVRLASYFRDTAQPELRYQAGSP
jgi:Tfp pilus assembly protein PilO